MHEKTESERYIDDLIIRPEFLLAEIPIPFEIPIEYQEKGYVAMKLARELQKQLNENLGKLRIRGRVEKNNFA